MKTSAALLARCLLYLCVAEVSGYSAIWSCEQRMRQLEEKLSKNEELLAEMKKTMPGTRVAFGASLGNVGNVGPHNTEITLLFKNVHSNTGAYHPSTGIFTAPVKGVYYFSFSGHTISYRNMGLRLMKNGKQVVTAYNHRAGHRFETVTNGMALDLDVGDHVYMRLRANTWIYDNSNSHSTFVGFLL